MTAGGSHIHNASGAGFGAWKGFPRLLFQRQTEFESLLTEFRVPGSIHINHTNLEFKFRTIGSTGGWGQ